MVSGGSSDGPDEGLDRSCELWMALGAQTGFWGSTGTGRGPDPAFPRPL